jgi:hypothetical protein
MLARVLFSYLAPFLILATWLSPAPRVPGPGLAPSPAAQEFKGGMHSDPRFGFKVRPPKEWLGIPVKIDEGWLIAKYLSKRTYLYHDKTGGWTYEFKPEMMVIAFIEEVVKKEGPDVETEDNVTTITWTNRYEDYPDYLKKTYRGGGYYISKEEKKKINGVSTTCLEIRVEKLARGGPKRILTWIYHLPDVDIAIQIEVLEEDFKKLKNTVERTLKSFKAIERTGALPTEQAANSSIFRFVSLSEQEKMTPDERRDQRVRQTEDRHRKTIDSLTEGWSAKRIGRFLTVSNCDVKYSKRIAAQVEAVWKWLDKTFPFVGPEEYVREPILRVCKTSAEERSYSRGGGSAWGGIGLEFVTNREDGGKLSFENGWVSQRMLRHWFQDRDRDLFWALPEWLDYGLSSLAENSNAKGSKLRFYPDTWARDDLRKAAREGRLKNPRDLMQMSRTELRGEGGQGMWNTLRESEAFVYFLLAGGGEKNKKFREIIPSYLHHLKGVLEEVEEKEDEARPVAASAPTTEEEEEERFRGRRENLRDREKENIEEVFRRTFADWSDADWKSLERAYFKSIN